MRTIYAEITPDQATLIFATRGPARVAITFSDDVAILSVPPPPGLEVPRVVQRVRSSDPRFPPRDLIELAIVEILREQGGRVKITQDDWNIYDEVAARLGVSMEAR